MLWKEKKRARCKQIYIMASSSGRRKIDENYWNSERFKSDWNCCDSSWNEIKVNVNVPVYEYAVYLNYSFVILKYTQPRKNDTKQYNNIKKKYFQQKTFLLLRYLLLNYFSIFFYFVRIKPMENFIFFTQ